MESPGKRLKALRLEKGLSLEDVQKKTKIKLDILKAIEDDNFINLSPIYVKGFLKIYCKFLDVNPQDYAIEAKETQADNNLNARLDKKVSFSKSAPVQPKNGYNPKLYANIVKVVILVAGLALALWFANFTLRKVFVFVKQASSVKKPAAAHKPVSAKKPSAVKPVPKKETIGKKIHSAASTTDKIKLVARAKEDCWVEVKVDGQWAFKNILRRGRVESWDARNRIDLSLGNAAGVDLEVNTRVISGFGRRGQVLKNIVITKEGINIPQ